MSTLLHNPPPSRTTLPGPHGLPLVGALPSMLRTGMFEYIEKCWREYGDMFQIPIGGGKRIVVVSHPDAIEKILQDSVRNFYKGRSFDPIRPLLGSGLVTSVGDFWKRQRKLSQPAFHLEQLREFVVTIHQCSQEMLASWADRTAAGTPLDLHVEMMNVAQRVIGLTLFGIDLGGTADASTEAVTHALDIAGERVNRGIMAIPLAIPTPANLRYKRAIRTIDTMFRDIVARARRGDLPTKRTTLLQLLMAARDEDTGEMMTDQQLRDELVTFYVAGYETTALTMTWALYWLDRHPEIADRVREEVQALSPSSPPSLEELDQLRYLRMVLDESMRLRPPVWAQTRTLHEDDTLLGHPIAADTMVLFSMYFCHRHPGFWDEPEVFRPERFTPEAVKARHRYAHFPFSAGPRSCIGRRFALYEMLVILSQALTTHRVKLLPGPEVGMKVAATCVPDRPMLMRYEPAPTTPTA